MDCIIHGVAKSQTQLSDFHFHLEYSQSCTINLQSNFRTVSLPQRKSVPISSHSSTPLFLSPLQLLIYFVFVNFTIPFHINGIIYYMVIYISHFSLSRKDSMLIVRISTFFSIYFYQLEANYNIIVVFAIHGHGFTCIPHPDPLSHLPLHPIPRCPSADKWIRKLWYIQTMEYYLAIKKKHT